MLFKKKSKQAGADDIDEGLPLTLQRVGMPSLYHFPASVVRAHRQMITRLMRDQSLKGRLSVVSAIRGEGVTFTSLALAATLSHDFSQRVCYVDLNWWWPSPQLAKLSELSPGVTGILDNDEALEDVVIQTSIPTLSLLPAGNLPPQQRPIIARSPALNELLVRISESFDTLVLDIPAILATSDGFALAAQGMKSLLVVQQGITPTPSIKQALDDMVDVPVMGVLLNRVKVATPAWLQNWIPDL